MVWHLCLFKLERVDFIDNRSGGLFELSGGIAKFYDCTFSQEPMVTNDDRGGAMLISGAETNVMYTYTTFSNVQSAADGSAIAVINGASITMESSIFHGNIAVKNGDALSAKSASSVHLRSTSFQSSKWRKSRYGQRWSYFVFVKVANATVEDSSF